jgi:hypothetical protein
MPFLAIICSTILRWSGGSDAISACISALLFSISPLCDLNFTLCSQSPGAIP